MIEIISILLAGKEFIPCSFVESLKSNEKIVIKNVVHKGDIGKYSKRKVEHGYCDLMFPGGGINGRLEEYEKQYITFLERNYGLMQKNGVSDIQLWTDLYITKETHSYEIFDRKMLKKIGDMNIALPFEFHVFSKIKIIKFAELNNIIYDNVDDLF